MAKKKTDAEIFADRIKKRFKTADHLIERQLAVMDIVKSTNKAFKADLADFGMIADALGIIAEEAKAVHDESVAHHLEQQAAVSHGLETRELWEDWRNQAAGDTMIIKELRDVYFKLSPDMLADHLSVAEKDTVVKGLEKLRRGDPVAFKKLKAALQDL